jgi:hypothetical protein
MSHSDNIQTVTTAVTSPVKLCPYNEEESAIRFLLIEAQFTAAGIKSQKLKYANALARLPKQVLQDILDTVDVCNESDQPFDLLKEVCLGSSKRENGSSILSCIVHRSKLPRASPLHMIQKKMDPGDLMLINAISIW